MKDCCAGCQIFSEGDIGHHEDCVNYKGSYSAKIAELKSENEKLKEALGNASASFLGLATYTHDEESTKICLENEAIIDKILYK